MKLTQLALAVALLLATSVASPAITVKCTTNCTVKIGKFTYIGEDQQNQASFFVVDITKPTFFPDLTFSNIAVVVKDAVINSGPETVQILPTGTPFGLLYVFGPPYNGAATCKDQSCVSVALFCTAPAVPNGVCHEPMPRGERSTCPHMVRSHASVFFW